MLGPGGALACEVQIGVGLGGLSLEQGDHCEELRDC